jgi:hypothetical protein
MKKEDEIAASSNGADNASSRDCMLTRYKTEKFSLTVQMNPDGATSSHVTEAAHHHQSPAQRNKANRSASGNPGVAGARRHSGARIIQQCGWSPGITRLVVQPKNAK